jgi:hypothetical protein
MATHIGLIEHQDRSRTRFMRYHLNRREQHNDADQPCTEPRDHFGTTDVGTRSRLAPDLDPENTRVEVAPWRHSVTDAASAQMSFWTMAFRSRTVGTMALEAIARHTRSKAILAERGHGNLADSLSQAHAESVEIVSNGEDRCLSTSTPIPEADRRPSESLECFPENE